MAEIVESQRGKIGDWMIFTSFLILQILISQKECSEDLSQLGQLVQKPVEEVQKHYEALLLARSRAIDDESAQELNFRSIARSPQAENPQHPLFQIDRGRWQAEAMLHLISAIKEKLFQKDDDQARAIESLTRYWIVGSAASSEIFSPNMEKEMNIFPISRANSTNLQGLDPISAEIIKNSLQFNRPPQGILTELLAIAHLVRTEPEGLHLTPKDLRKKLLKVFQKQMSPELWDWLDSEDPKLKNFQSIVLRSLKALSLVNAIGTRGNQSSFALRSVNGSRILLLDSPTRKKGNQIVFYLEEPTSLERYVSMISAKQRPDLVAHILLDRVEFNKYGLEIKLRSTKTFSPQEIELLYPYLKAEISNLQNSFSGLIQKKQDRLRIIIESDDAELLQSLEGQLDHPQTFVSQSLRPIVENVETRQSFETQRFSRGTRPTFNESEMELWASEISLHGGLMPIDPKNFKQAFSGSKLIMLNAGESLIREGDSSEFVYLILSGEYDITLEGASLRDTRRRNGLLGDMGVITNSPRNAFVNLSADSKGGTLLAIPADKYRSYWLAQTYNADEAIAAIRARFRARQQSSTPFVNPLVLAEQEIQTRLGEKATDSAVDAESRLLLAQWAEGMKDNVRSRNAGGSGMLEHKSQQLSANQKFASEFEGYRAAVGSELTVTDKSASVGKLQGNQRRSYRYKRADGIWVSVAETLKAGEVIDREMIVMTNEGLRFLKKDKEGKLDEGAESRACIACHLQVGTNIISFGGTSFHMNVERIRIPNIKFGGTEIIGIPAMTILDHDHQ